MLHFCFDLCRRVLLFLLNSTIYDFVFGWSTGHVGTNALSSANLYSSSTNHKFIFEADKNLVNNSTNFNLERKFKEKWKHFSHNDEYEYVTRQYMPDMIRLRGNYTTLVDFGHQNLYFIHGLLKYFENHKFKILFVRIHRERHETAISMNYARSSVQFTDLCKDLLYRYCPFERTTDVINHPPEDTVVWNTFTEYQKALWMIDEVEARWTHVVSTHPKIDALEVLWSKSWEGSFAKSAEIIASALRLNVSSWIRGENAHAAELSESTWRRKELYDLDRLYRQAMKYPYLPGRS